MQFTFYNKINGKRGKEEDNKKYQFFIIFAIYMTFIFNTQKYHLSLELAFLSGLSIFG